jgi:hypothetical protein
MLMDWETHCPKDVNFPKIDQQNFFFVELDKLILKFMLDNKRSRIAWRRIG